MPKHKKTLKEKKLADIRHKFYTLPLTKVKTDHTPISAESAPVVSVIKKYPHLMPEVQKIGIVTALIIAVQVILFFLLKKQILVLPMVKY